MRIDARWTILNPSPSSSPLGKGRGEGSDGSSTVILFVGPCVRILFRISIFEIRSAYYSTPASLKLK